MPRHRAMIRGSTPSMRARGRAMGMTRASGRHVGHDVGHQRAEYRNGREQQQPTAALDIGEKQVGKVPGPRPRIPMARPRARPPPKMNRGRAPFQMGLDILPGEHLGQNQRGHGQGAR